MENFVFVELNRGQVFRGTQAQFDALKVTGYAPEKSKKYAHLQVGDIAYLDVDGSPVKVETPSW